MKPPPQPLDPVLRLLRELVDGCTPPGLPGDPRPHGTRAPDKDLLERARALAHGAVSATEFWAASPDDLRAAGWSVAVHNDYRLNGVAHTFWLFTKGDHAVKGEGCTDAEALQQVRAGIVRLEARSPEGGACPSRGC